MQLPIETVLAIAGAVVGAQSAAIVWLAKQLVHCWEARAAADAQALGRVRTSTAQAERAVRAGQGLA